MKKTYFTVVAVLLVILMAGCGVDTPSAPVDNEEGLVITIRSSDGSRSLTTPIAAAGADFFEVVFDNDATKVRTSWGNGATGKILPGNGVYDNSAVGGTSPVYGKAYMFAGRNGTLLGVGRLTKVIPDPTAGPQNAATGPLTIDMAYAKEVEFTITALNTDVGGLANPVGTPASPANADGSNPALSTFKFPATGFNGTNVGSLLLDASQTPPLTAPVFLVPLTQGASAATFDITNTAGISLGAAGTPLHVDLKSAILAATGPKVIFSGYLWEKGNSPFAAIAAASATVSATGIVVGESLPIPIPLNIDPGIKAGLGQVAIEIPVTMYDVAADADDNGTLPVTWYIRGGLNNTAADLGAAFNDGDGSLGGAIIIGVGNFNKNAAGLIISSQPPAP